MSEPTHINPVAVPWTPDMTGQTTPVPAAVPAPVTPQPAPVQSQPAYQQAQPHPQQQQPYAPQPVPQLTPQVRHQPAPQAAPQYRAQTPATHGQPHMAQPHMGQPQQQPYQAAPAQNRYVQNTQAQNAPAQPVYNQPAQAHSQAQPQQQVYQQSPTAHMSLQQGQQRTMPPQLAPHMTPAAQQVPAAPSKPNGLLGKILKRSPKPDQVDPNINMHGGQMAAQLQNRLSAHMPTEMPGQIQQAQIGQVQMPAQINNVVPQMGAGVSQALPQIRPASGSWLNKSFLIGAVTGLLIGAFVLPLIINLFAGDSSKPTQTLAQTAVQSPSVDGDVVSEVDLNVPASDRGQNFLDAAIAADES